MQFMPQDLRYQFLNSLMKENRISLKAIYECANGEKNDIDNMNHIFDSDDEMSVRKRLVLLSLISRDQAGENIEYYRKAKNYGTELVDSDINQYKVVLITALLFNTAFYVSACNWCGIIRREVNRIGARSPIRISEGKPNRVILRFPEPKNDAIAADGTGFATFLQTPLVWNDIHGTLYFKGNDQHEVFLMFVFDESQKAIPFGLEVNFTTKYDHKEHVITVSADNHIEGTAIIKSDITGDIYYSDGIEGDYTVIVEPVESSAPPDNFHG